MDRPRPIDRRTVLKTMAAGVAGGTALAGPAAAHGSDPPRVPSWFEDEIWEMAVRDPVGTDPTDDNSHAPIWQLAPGTDGKSCPQVPAGLVDFSFIEDGNTFASGAWASVAFDHTLSAFPFSTLWHVHWVFDDGATTPYEPSDLVNASVIETGGSPVPLTSGSKIRAAESLGNVSIESIPFVFNCPIRPADDTHRNYCD